MRDYTEFIDQFQEDTLSAIKTAQETGFKAFAAMRDYAANLTPDFTKNAAQESFATTTELIEKSFDFASKFIEMQKEYAIKAAEYVAMASKKAAETGARAARTAKRD